MKVRQTKVRRRIVSSMHAPADSNWNNRVEVLSPKTTPSWMKWLFRVILESPGRDAFIFRGTSGFSEGYRDLIAAGLIRRLHPKSHIIMSDSTIEPGSHELSQRLPSWADSLLKGLSRSLIHFVDGKQVTWCVLSTAELESFPRTWGVTQGAISFTPFSHTMHGYDGNTSVPTPVNEGAYVFSGGNSLRDYNLLLRALDGLDVDLRVATSWTPPAGHPRQASFEHTSHEEFFELLLGSRLVVLPLEVASRSTGQATYLNAMALGKVVVVNDAPGVRDHIVDGKTGIVVGSVGEMRDAINHALDPTNRTTYDAIRERARREVLSHRTPDDYRRRLLEIANR